MRCPGWLVRSAATTATAACGLLAAHASAAGPDTPSTVSDADRARARAAYDAGIEAGKQHRWKEAATLFTEADSIVPNVVALRMAIATATLADEAAQAVQLCRRAEGRPADRELAEVIEKALARFAGRTGDIRVECGASPCTATIDGAPAATEEPIPVAVGSHVVVIDDGKGVSRQSVDVRAGPTAVVSPVGLSPGGPTDDAESTGSDGGSPAWFWVALGATAVLGGVTIWSAVDTRERHEAYLETGTGAEEGKSAQVRTDVLFFSTIGLALATAAVGIFAVDWTGDGSATVALAIGAGAANLRGRF